MGVSIWEGNKAERLVDAIEQIAIAQSTGIDITNYRQIADIVKYGKGREFFHIGDQVITDWSDGTNTFTLPWDIVDFGPVKDPLGNIHPNAMWLESHYALPGVQFSGNNAFFVTNAIMAPGTYFFTIGNNWGTHCVQGKIYEFTTTKEIPANSQLVLGTASSNTSGLPDTDPANWRVRTYKTPYQKDPDEILVLTDVESSSGTDLGVLSSNTVYGEHGINNMQRAAYGYNRWGHSAIRQWLNSMDDPEAWWKSKNPFDHRPDQLANMRGFMAGLPADFLSIINPVKVTTALNTVTDRAFGDSEDTTDRFFLASLQQEFINPQISGVEGSEWEYWVERLGTQHQQGTVRQEHIRYAIENHGAAQNCRLRSANRGYASNTWTVNSSGNAYGTNATSAHRPVPACVIY
jgi:hypothetical protein